MFKYRRMKQVSNTKKFFVLTSPSINRRTNFSTYPFVISFVVISMLGSSCLKEDVHVKKTVPFKSKFETVEESFSSTEDQITGTGSGTPIGKSTFVGYSNFENFPLVKGTTTFTTANGDRIFTTFSGSVEGPDNSGNLQVTNDNLITGGT